MNTMMTFTLTLILAGSASAQTLILPGGRGNFYIGTPANLPGPMANIVISPRINLPAPILTPTVVLTLAPAALPLNRVLAERENVSVPFPALSAHFAAPATDGKTKDDAAAREKLDNLFDGRKPAEKLSDDERGPVRPSRHVGLPEHELENEIGAN